MREGRPSFTAACVAFARGVAAIDPVARELVGAPFSTILRAHERARWLTPALNAASLGLVDHVELRTRAIDRAVRDGVARGARQLVILGAGLDARAYRLDALRDVVVFEVDHPATQGYKRARVQGLMPTAREVRFVAVDFEHDSLEERLDAAGHRAGLPTFWIWEGVTPYLGRDAVRATLQTIVKRSAGLSRVAVTYGTPDASTLGTRFTRAASLVFRAIGEPLRGLMTPREMADELASAGLALLSDADPIAWAEGEKRRLYVHEHLAVAEKR